MDNNNGGNNTNTILIVIVLIILVGLGVWWFTMRNNAGTDNPGIDVDVSLPTGDTGAAGGTFPEGSGEVGGPAE